jgi:hypothetical protein
VFGEALQEPDPFECRVCTADPEPLATGTGYRVSGLAPSVPCGTPASW